MSTTADVTNCRLAAAVLFGDQFAADAPDALLADFRASQGRWAEMIRQIWAFTGAGQAPAPAVSAPLARQTARSQITEAASSSARKPERTEARAPVDDAAGTPGLAWFEAQMSTASDEAKDLAAEKPKAADRSAAGTAVFDPSVNKIQLNMPKSRAELRSRLVELLSKASGYPADVFDDDLDLEVDLGIDSIKQVQMLGKVRAESGLQLDEDFQLRDYRTLREIVDYLGGRLGL